MRNLLPLLLLGTLACKKDDPTRVTGDTDPPTDTGDTDDTDPPPGNPVVGPGTPQTIDVTDVLQFQATGLADGQAYRVTLVHGDNVTRNPDGTGTFVDGDANGAADAGPSEEVGQIWAINNSQIPPAKTFPAGTDDPNNPTGIYPQNGVIDIHVEGYGGGTLYPVVYTNAGASTFLEIDSAGVPIEPYGIGNAITVDAPPPPPIGMEPLTPGTYAIGETRDYTISGLNPAYYYRVTLVVTDNITPDGTGGATFVDGDANGAADAGASELIAGLSYYNGNPIDPPAKTYPAGTDDPNNPTAIAPNVDGEITITVEGIGAGTIYPVAYRNGGASTFLEIDGSTYAPVEDYTVGGSFTVQ